MDKKDDSLELARRAWNICMEAVETNISPEEFKTWFKPIEAISLKGNLLEVKVPSAFFMETIEDKYLKHVFPALRSAIGEKAGLAYVVDKMTSPQTGITVATHRDVDISGGIVSPPVIEDVYIGVGQNRRTADPQFNPHYTFDSYVIGDSNKMAVSVAQTVASAPGKTVFNPFYIYGGPGVGKTHLIQAIGLQVKENNPNGIVVYMQADRFMRQYQEAAIDKKIPGFVSYFQGVNLLIIDDIQELKGGSGTADIFFQIFNHLLHIGKQVVLASDKKPADMTSLPERLVSRFKSGMVAEVKPPDTETRLAIFKSMAKAEGLEVPDDVSRYVATNISGHARELRGVIASLCAFSTIAKTDINMSLAQQVISLLVSKQQTQMLTKETIAEAVCAYFKIEVSMLQLKSKKREIVIARQIAMYLCKKLTTDSLSVIGESLGGRNHSTVLYACKAIENLMETDNNVKEAIVAIEESLKA